MASAASTSPRAQPGGEGVKPWGHLNWGAVLGAGPVGPQGWASSSLPGTLGNGSGGGDREGPGTPHLVAQSGQVGG